MRLGIGSGVFVVAALVGVSLPAQDRFAKWEGAIAAFERQDREDPPQPGGVLFLGSSSIRMWKLDESFPGMRVVNRGFGGSEIIDSVHFFERIVVPHAPRCVVFYAGDNDIAHDTAPEQVHANFEAFVGLLHKHLPETRLVYVPIKPSLKRWNLIEQGRQANGLIRA
ncbi:MAG: hypothetical protein KDA58_02595, partial [Planctomycetaceae bacterium]|nr:hypothetical protein [Planctomycetaceae bacterium]